jgi:hypothetical protein
MLNDHEFEALFRSRFSHWEEPPPPGAWQVIRAARRKPFYRRPLAVAAVLLCLGLMLLPAGRRVYKPRVGQVGVAAKTGPVAGGLPVRGKSLASAGGTSAGAAEGTGSTGTQPDGTQAQSGRTQTMPRSDQGQVRSSGGNRARENGRSTPQEAAQRAPTAGIAANRKPLHESGSRDAAEEPGRELARTERNVPSVAMPLSLDLPTEDLAAAGLQPLPISPQPFGVPAIRQKKASIQPKAQPPPLGGYTVGAFVAPRYSFNRYVPNRQDAWLVSNIQAGNGLRKRLGWEAGITVRKMVTRHLSWNAGLSYLNLGETLQFEATAAQADSLIAQVLPGQGIAITPVRRTVHQTYDSRYHYVGLRAGISYHFLTTPLQDLYVTGGAGANVLVKGVTILSGEDGVAGTYHFPSPRNPLEQLNYALHAGIGFARRIGPRVSLTCEPTVSYFVGSTFKRREPVGLRPYSLGLAVGLRFGEKPFRAP